ncbi:DNA/RNA non-specific endonuclease [Microbacterium sp. DT81.1]|uniref:DNA/RNA non-specific endonuclease n=1 Tax=Microbacterium sp. DT81.1 TaxID=3393413 RepID=UPI003CF8D919
MTTPAYVEALRRAIAAPDAHGKVSIGLEDAVDLLASAPPAPSIDPDYAGRPGYDRVFLDGTPLPLPSLTGAAARDTVKFAGPNGKTDELRYHHFSVVMSKSRRFARLTAVNIDGGQSVEFDRENDAWSFDPRIDKKFQVGNALYADNPFDRGHLVRRLDPVWGGSEVASFANGDTFHFTNCAPQHERFNRNPQVWAGIENYILKNADSRDVRVTVFTAPVLRTTDPQFSDIRVPLQFWKVVAFRRANGALASSAYLLSQEKLVEDVVADQEFVWGAYKTFQVSVSRVATSASLDLGPLVPADVLAGLDDAEVLRPILALADIRI